jgi:hypothetical protein
MRPRWGECRLFPPQKSGRKIGKCIFTYTEPKDMIRGWKALDEHSATIPFIALNAPGEIQLLIFK